MAVARPPRLTKEDYRQLPDTGPRYQLIEGELQNDAEKPAATHGEKDTFTSPLFPGLGIRVAQIFKR
jgi:hypothetical protein